MTDRAIPAIDPDGVTFARALDDYRAAGWARTFPLPVGQKDPPPTAVTGKDGTAPDPVTLAAFRRAPDDSNLGIAVPHDLLGVDVDQYDTKRGWDSLTALLERLGVTLPPTWRSTSRGAGDPSGIRFFRVPPGLFWRTAPLPGIELIAWHHRYAVVWPSVHPEGRPYLWYDDADDPLDRVPLVAGDWPDLPWQLVKEWTRAEEEPDDHEPAAPQRADQALWHPKVTAKLAEYTSRNGGSRHETALAVSAALCRHEQFGLTGTTTALDQLGDRFIADIAPDRGDMVAAAEWARMLSGGRIRVQTTASTSTYKPDPGTGEIPDHVDHDTGEIRHRDETPAVRPDVVVNGRPLPDITDEIIGHLETANDPPTLFIRSGEITSVRTDETGAPLVEILSAYKVRDRISRVTDTLRVHKDGTASKCHPPIDIVHNVLAQPTWPFPALQAVTELPTLRSDGTIHDTPGYDPQTRLLYIPGDLDVPAIPATPTDNDIKAAVDTIRGDLLGDFPFDSDADLANAIGLLLTPLIRPAIRGQVPLALIDATEPGTGKGLLANVTAVIATGRAAAARPLSQNDEEARKMVLSALMSGPTLVVFDNIEAAISSPTLAGVLTTDEWVDRMLGRSEDVRVPNRATWIATGNNLAVGGDIGRRCYRIKLNARCANPDQRTGFTHPDLIEWARDHRGQLVAALLTLTRAWWSADCPTAPGTLTLGGFTPWVRTVSGIVHHAGIEGFLGNLVEFRQTIDIEGQQWETFLGALHDLLGGQPTTAGAIANKLTEGGHELKDTIPARLIADIERPVFARRLGDAFRQREGRRHGPSEWAVINAGTNRLKTALWTIESMATETAGSRGVGSEADLSNSAVTENPQPLLDPAREPQVRHQARGHAGSSSANARAKSYPQETVEENFTERLAEDDPASPRAPHLTSTSRAGSEPPPRAPTTDSAATPQTNTQSDISAGALVNPGELGPYEPEF